MIQNDNGWDYAVRYICLHAYLAINAGIILRIHVTQLLVKYKLHCPCHNMEETATYWKRKSTHWKLKNQEFSWLLK